MFLKRIEIDNYKSLKGVVVEPTPLAVLVGPNAAGKTNFCEALDFLAHAYKWSLEEAVAYKGGYENICFRGARGLLEEPIRFRALLEVERFVVDHRFQFDSPDEGSGAFSVIFEDLTVKENGADWLRLIRTPEQIQVESPSAENHFLITALSRRVGKSALSFSTFRYLENWGQDLTQDMEALRVFQINAREARAPGVPIPDPDLGRFGSNLPAVILHLKKNHPGMYGQILENLRNVLPDVEDLDVEFTHTRTLALFVRQRGQSWPVENLSDGTLQAISTLAAVFDPRISILVLEEPENNVHPWALRGFAEAFREASKTKQIILTTHSPILLDQLKPEEIWIVQKPGAVTKIDPLLTLDPSLKESWEHGRFTLSEYLDSGALPEAVPAAAP
jgi:predicted ATPase